MSFNAGDVEAKLTLDRSEFNREMREAQSDVERFERTYEAKLKVKIDDKDLNVIQKKLNSVAKTYEAKLKLTGDKNVITSASVVEKKLKGVAKTYNADIKLNVKNLGASAQAQKALNGINDRTVTLRVRTVTDNKLPTVAGQFDSVTKAADKTSNAIDRHQRKLVLLGSAIVVSIAPALGTLTAAFMVLPGLVSVFGSAIGTVALGVDGLKKAASLAEPAFNKLKETVSTTFYEGFKSEFKDLGDRVIPGVTRGIDDIALSLVGMGREFYKTMTSADSMNKINSILQNTKSAIDTMSPAVSSFGRSFLTVAQIGSQSMIGLGTQVNIFAKGWEAMINRVANNGQLAGAFGQLNNIIGALLGIFTKLVEVGINMANDVGPSLTDALNVLGDTITAIGPGLSALARIFLDTLTPTLKALNPILEILSGALQRMANFWASLPEPVRGFLGVLALVLIAGPKVVGAITGIIATLGGLTTAIRLLATGQFAAAFAAMVPGAKTAGTNAGTAAATGVKGGWAGIFGKAVGGLAAAFVIGVIVDQISGGKITAFFEEIKNGFVSTDATAQDKSQGISGAIARLTESPPREPGAGWNDFRNWPGLISGDWQALSGRMSPAVDSVLIAIEQGFIKIPPEVQAAGDQAVQRFVGALAALPPQARTTAEGTQQAIKEALIPAMPQTGAQAAQQLTDNLMGGLRNAPNLINPQGNAIADSIGGPMNRLPAIGQTSGTGLVDNLQQALGRIPGMTTQVQQQITGVGQAIQGLPPGKAVTINAITDQARVALEGMGFTVRTLPNGQIEVTARTQQALDNLGAVVGQINTSNGAININGNPAGANAITGNTLGMINGSSGTVGINGNNVPALGTLGNTQGQINGTNGTMGVLGDANRAGGASTVSNAVFAFINGMKPLMEVRATDGPARQVVAAFQAFVSGLRLVVSIIANKIGFAGGTPVLPAFESGGLPEFDTGAPRIPTQPNKKRTVGSGFKTTGATAIVGEGNPAYPEFVIPTDPKYRKNAITLYESLGNAINVNAKQLARGDVNSSSLQTLFSIKDDNINDKSQWASLISSLKNSKEYQSTINEYKTTNNGISEEKLEQLLTKLIQNSSGGDNISIMQPRDTSIKELVQEIMFQKRHSNKGI